MVQVGVREHDVSDRVSRDLERLPVEAPQGALALIQAAVHEQPGPSPLEQEPASRHRAGSAEEREGARHAVSFPDDVAGYRVSLAASEPLLSSAARPASSRAMAIRGGEHET